VERRRFIRRVVAGLLTSPLVAEAEQAKIARIGFLLAGPLTANPHLVEAFLQGLHDLGYVEGRNLMVELRSAEGNLERLPRLATELVKLKVDVIVAPATVSTRATMQLTRTIPIIFIGSGDPVAGGFVTSLARPGGNVTGFAVFGPELLTKRLELLRQTLPRVSRVAVLWQPVDYADRSHFEGTLKAAELSSATLGVRVQFVAARDPDDFERAFSDMSREQAGAVFINIGSRTQRRRLVDLAAKNRLPAIYQTKEFAVDGGLISYGPDFADLDRRAATYVDKILKGAKPADLPVEQPTKLELVINLKTAKALGLTIPPSLLARADQVIE